MTQPSFRSATVLLNSLPDAVIVIGIDGRIALWNAGAERLMGWAASEMLGQNASSFLGSDGGRAWKQFAVESGGAESYQGRLEGLTRAGNAIPLAIHIVPLREEGGQSAGWLLLARRADSDPAGDGGRRPSAEQAQRHGTLPALLQSLTDGLFLVDTEGRVSVWNAPMENLAGIAATDVVGQPSARLFEELLPLAEAPELVRQDLQQALDQIAEQPVLYLTLRGPHARLLQLRLFPVEDSAGVSLGWGGLVRDLTRADESNVLATVLHELRTPLAAIKGYVTTLLGHFRRWEPAAVEEFLETINDSTDQLSGLVESLLDMSRLESGTLTLQRRPLNLPELAGRVVDEFEFRAPRHKFAIHFAEGFPQPEADRLRVEQVLRNLLQNAVKYSPQGGVITISGEAAPASVVVRVRDEGIGIAIEEQERVFDRFYQAEGGQVAGSAGAGLGLYICRRLVEAHGGRIWIEQPDLGPGSIVALELPLTAAAEPQAARVSEGTPTGRPAPAPGAFSARSPETTRVLIVDDDRRLARFVKANLESAGHEVLTAWDGEAAIEAVERELPDLILLDLMLPKMGGYAVCARVREFSQVPIIMLTARADEADLVRGLDLGADDYLTKPFGTKELLARVQAVLRRSRFSEEAPPQPALVRGDLTVDFARRRVTVGDREVSLTPTEYKLLYHLAINAGHVLTHQQLLRKVWGPAYETENAYLWVYVSRLRKKIEPDPDHPQLLLSETGVGYRFAA